MNLASIYQVSTLNALMLGYTRKAVTVAELLRHGDTGLGTFENVDGEMIVADGRCFRAADDGSVVEMNPEVGVPFASVAFLDGDVREFDLQKVAGVDALRSLLDLKIEEGFGLNSMHVVRIDGAFDVVRARSERGFSSQHVELKEILKDRQKDFAFENAYGSLICLYHPDFMQGINAAGWHFHFISEDRTRGGHVFDVSIAEAHVRLKKLSQIRIQLPTEAAFDTYSLTQASQGDIKKVEQGK